MAKQCVSVYFAKQGKILCFNLYLFARLRDNITKEEGDTIDTDITFDAIKCGVGSQEKLSNIILGRLLSHTIGSIDNIQ